MRSLEQMLEKFEKIVSKNFCHDLAKRVGFIQRSTSQLKGHEFAQAMMVPNAFLEAETLNSLASRMQRINRTCNLSAPALAQRINTKQAEMFMKACFETVLRDIVKQDFTDLGDLSNLSCFNRVLIEDSTQAELHEKLSPHFKGSGGVASKSAIKIDYIFDYLSEVLVDVDFFAGNTPDQGLAGRLIPMLKKNDLVVRDLGYYTLGRLQEIEHKEAYYISRWKVDVAVYDSKDAIKPLDLAKFLDQRLGCDGIVDLEVFVGKEKHPVRLVGCLMSEEAINKRRRTANRSAQRHGRQMSKKKAALLKYSIFITNIPFAMLSRKIVMAIYRARWRVELIFKQWKSCLKLHVFKGYNRERFHCFLYGRLIMILLLGSISPILIRFALTLGRELSCFKLTKYLVADHVFPRVFYEGKMSQFINQLMTDLPRRLCMDKRKRFSLRNNVKNGNSYYTDFTVRDLQAFAS